MWLFQGLRVGNLLFFSRVNPDIETGGFFSEEKWPIYQLFPPDYVPRGSLISPDLSIAIVFQKLNEASLSYPVLVKPNIGERGMGIEKLADQYELSTYHQGATFNYIVQEFIPYPNEMSVLAYRIPGKDKVSVTSLCLKEKLAILGDGVSTIEQLINRDYRSRQQWTRIQNRFDGRRILGMGKSLILEPIGNHSRGTTFLNGNHLISEDFRLAVQQLFHTISGQIFYGRFDIIYESIDDIIQLKNFKVIEFNGVGSEPAHIYQPGYSLVKAYQCLWQHAKILGDISLVQKKNGIRTMSWSEFRQALRLYRLNLNLVNKNA